MMNKSKKNKVVLVTDLMNPLDTRSSTQMLDYSIIDWMSQNKNIELFVFGLVVDGHDCNKIASFLESKKIRFVLKYQKYNLEKNKSAFNKMSAYVFGGIFNRCCFSKNDFNSIDFVPDFIVSLCPSIESASVGVLLSKKYKHAKFVTVWTDVLSFNGLPKQVKIPFKRIPIYLAERHILNSSNKILYLGKPQADYQKSNFPKYSSKIDFYNPSYLPIEYFKNISIENNKTIVLGYFGSFNYRNMEPLVSVAESWNKEQAYFKIIGTGNIDKKLLIQNNHSIVKKVTKIVNSSDSFGIELSFDVLICLTFKDGFSLPGKAFYTTAVKPNRPIIIVFDGSYSKEMAEYMQSFKRYIIAENTVESISSAVEKSISILKESHIYNNDCFNPETAYKKILS